MTSHLLKRSQCTFLAFEEEFFATHLYHQQKHHEISTALQYQCVHRRPRDAGESAHSIFHSSPDHPEHQLLDSSKALQFACGPSDGLSEVQCYLRSQAHQCRVMGSQTQEMLEQNSDGHMRQGKNDVANDVAITLPM